ncbi:MAG: dihydropteroate synthase [Deltaproteobacteria bacterium]|jgi:dihydropteroate synthase|nr:dihydropteroate synthase [Deltaproteobacteria bacterium]
MRYTPPPLKVHGFEFKFDQPLIMAIINTTPDSFFDGSKNYHFEEATASGEKAIFQGAHILDIGGESTRPGSERVSSEEELKRVMPTVAWLAEQGHAVSIDTMKAEVAQNALDAGACIVNDVSGGRFDDNMFSVVKDYGAALVIGHMRGMPETMQDNINFADVVTEVSNELKKTVAKALKAGISKNKIIIDPGIGFGKTVEQCSILIARTGEISKQLELPVLIGVSNKSFIGNLSENAPVDKRTPGTVAANIFSLLSGAHIFRVHDTFSAKQSFQVAQSIIPFLKL